MIIITSFTTANRFEQIGNGLIIYKSFTDGNMTIECSGSSTCNTIQFTKDGQIFNHDPKNMGTISLTSGIMGTKYQLYAIDDQGIPIHLFQVTVKPFYIDLGIFNTERYSIATSYKLIYQLLLSKKITLMYFIRYWNVIALVANGSIIAENYDVMIDMLFSYDHSDGIACLYSAEMIALRYTDKLAVTCGLYQLIARAKSSSEYLIMATCIFQHIFGTTTTSNFERIADACFTANNLIDWKDLALTTSLVNIG